MTVEMGRDVQILMTHILWLLETKNVITREEGIEFVKMIKEYFAKDDLR